MSKQQQRLPKVLVDIQEQQNQELQQSNAFLMGFLAGLTPEQGRLGANQSPDAWTKNLVDQMLNEYSTADLDALGQQAVSPPSDVLSPVANSPEVSLPPPVSGPEEVLPPVVSGPEEVLPPVIDGPKETLPPVNAGNDRIRQFGTREDDVLRAVGGGGNDRIRQSGRRGNDTLRANGGAGRDRILQRGGRGRDDLRADGGAGDDRIRQRGGRGRDRLNAIGRGGDDRINQRGGRGRDRLNADGGAGADRIRQRGGRGRDRLNADGGAGADRIRQRGGRGKDLLEALGRAGDDRIRQRGGRGRDQITGVGGLGNDRINQRGGRGRDTLEALGGRGQDRIRQRGGRGADSLMANGGKGDDNVRMKGGRGNDTLTYHVSSGSDKVRMHGGRGRDTALIHTNGNAVTVRNRKGEVLFSSDGERSNVRGRTDIEVRGIENIQYVTDAVIGEVDTGEQASENQMNPMSNFGNGGAPPSMSSPESPVSQPGSVTPEVSSPGGSGGVSVTPSTGTIETENPNTSVSPHNTQGVSSPGSTSGVDTGSSSVNPGATGTQEVTGPNRPPSINSVWTRTTQPLFNETVDVYFNASDPDWDPLSWDYNINGAHSENGSVGPTPWIKVSIDLQELGLQARDTFTVTANVTDPSGASDTESIDIEVFGKEIAVWEVLFDTQDVTDITNPDGGPTRIDPLIFDLNMDGQLDITGANQEGNGKFDGETVLFDMDPNRQGTTGWEFSSPGHRPGYYEGGNNSRVPAVPNGIAIYDTGEQESTNKEGIGRWYEDRSKGNSADIFDEEGRLVGQWREDAWGESHQGRIGQYYWGATGSGEHRERTEWMKGTGDGFLVWDHNGNGIIDDNTEMMSEFDIEGNETFKNGFEKLAHYFDHDGDGVIQGNELNGLMFWVDDGDAITEEGELQSLDKYGITHITIPTDDSLTSSATVGKAGKD